MNPESFISGIRRALEDMTLESWNTFFLSHLKRIIVWVTVFLLGTTVLLGWLSIRKMKEVVTDEFNQQQLLLARHAAGQIDNNLSALKNQLFLLSLSPSLQYFERVAIGKRMGYTFSSIEKEGAIEMRYVEHGENRTHLVDSSGYQTISPDRDDLDYLRWAASVTKRGAILVGRVVPAIHGSNYQKLIMKIAVPVRQVSVDETNPMATNRFSGALIFVVDATALLENLVSGIQSGKTGYAWVIDEGGMFLYHPEKNFMGRNALEARKEKMPTISFARINEIQKKMMLTGKEGMSWYITGWHRGKEGTMKKLIAFSPVHLDDTDVSRIWSVAVVAPVTEVEGAIHDVQVRQLTLQALIMIIILSGSMIVITLGARWSDSLKREVFRQTVEYRKSEQRYRSLVEHAEDMIFTVDLDGRFLSINTFGARFLRRPQEDIIGRRITEFFPKATSEIVIETIEEIINRKQGRQVNFLVWIEDREYYLNANFRRLMDEDGNIYAILCIARDMTDRKKIEEQSFSTEKLASLGTLSAGVAHEINNPLAIILGFADLLKEKISKDSPEAEMIDSIERQAVKAKKVVENLLAFARKKEHVEVEVDINSCIEEVLRVLRNSLMVNKISLPRLSLSEARPVVKGDPDELQQVFFNIMNNAVYAMKDHGGELSISTDLSEDAKEVEIRIEDTGPGIPREHRARVFDPLFTTKKVGDGTGLGLSVSYGIIKRHGGIITFDTATKDEAAYSGTVFFVTLPSASATPRSEDSGGHGIRGEV